ncbi:MAG: beta-ketoacyl-ACP synthase II [Bacteroidota bacterium]|nr:beta-ketoacyl-ACP synthase II [Bacteroidota bacterium]
MELKRVVVTGLGVLTPLGVSVSEFWDNLAKGVSGCEHITRFDTSKFKTKFGCEIKNFNVTDYLDKKEARKLDPYAQYAIIASDQAIADSGIDLEKLDLNKIGVIWGSGIGGSDTFLKEVSDFARGSGAPRFNPFFIPKMIADIASGQISIRHKLQGPNFTTVSACASSSNAIIDAYNYIRLGKAVAFVTGGSESAINEIGIGGFNAMRAISQNNEEYKTASRPFDATRDGFVMGEGAGSLILEELDHATARGAKIYCEIVGGGISADAHHLTAPHPEGDGAARVMIAALEDNNTAPEDIDYINVHGTATPLGDISEVLAIKRVFGKHAYNMNISSTKSMHGHILGAAGAVETIASIMTIIKNIIPPTINFTTPDPKIDYDLNFTFNKAQERDVKYALSNTFGFGGHNASIIIKEFSA